MRKTVLISHIFICSLICLYGSVPPLWLSSKNVMYPETEFISAVGTGWSAEDAKAVALSQLALYFDARISVDNSSGYSLSESNKKASSYRYADGETGVVSDTDLPAVQFSEPYYNEGRDEWSICAYILKEKAAEICASRVADGIKEVNSYLSLSDSSKGIFQKFSLVSKALKAGEKLKKDAGTLSVVSPGKNEVFEEVYRLIETCNSKFNSLKQEMVFSVKTKNDSTGVLSGVIRELLEGNGFICSDYNSNFLVEAEIKTTESENQIGVFVRPSVFINIIQTGENGRVLNSYSKQLSKYGHKNWDGAYGKAMAEVEKDLRANFMSVFY